MKSLFSVQVFSLQLQEPVLVFSFTTGFAADLSSSESLLSEEEYGSC